MRELQVEGLAVLQARIHLESGEELVLRWENPDTRRVMSYIDGGLARGDTLVLTPSFAWSVRRDENGTESRREITSWKLSIPARRVRYVSYTKGGEE